MKLVFLGASITEAGCSPHGFITLIGEALSLHHPGESHEWINAGVSGNNSLQMLERLNQDALRHRPDILTINVGLNDVWHDFQQDGVRIAAGNSGRGVALDAYESAIESIAVQTRSAGIQLTFLSPTAIYEDPTSEENRRLREYVEVQRNIAAKHGAIFVDMFAKFHRVLSAFHDVAGLNTLLLTTDGVHLNDAGNALMATGWLEAHNIPIRNFVAPN